jgi:hypothetical protein
LQRATVLAHMAARYGFTADGQADAPDTPPSSTERRIGQALQDAVLRAVAALCAQADAALDSPPSTSASAWQWQARIQVGDSDWQPLHITLDADASRTLEHYALRLLEKTVSTADIQALRRGSVLPIALGRTTVLLNGEALLTASVAEHHGKLHLTAFETLE